LAELDTKLSLLGQSLVSAVNERSKQRMKILAEIRSLLKLIETLGMPKNQSDVLARYSKSFLPVFFRVYTEIQEKSENKPIINEKELKLAVYETIRMYVKFIPQELVSTHVNLALKKVNDNSILDERKILIVNILIALCGRANSEAADAIFTYTHPWFLVDPKKKSLQKKAYRILTELYKRHDDPALEKFFAKIQPTVGDILQLESKAIAESALAPRLSLFRYILRSLDSMEKCEQFYGIIFTQLIVGMDRSHNSSTRQNAAKCFQDLIDKLIEFLSDEEESETLKIQVLDSIEAKIFDFAEFKVKTVDIEMERARSTLIAMNIFAQQHLKSMNGALISRFLNHATIFLKDSRPVIRVLAIRLMRIICKKLPGYMISQFQDYILESIFAYQPESENTSTIRKANRFLFETLIEKFGYEVVCKYIIGNDGLQKFMKNLEKTRRKKLAPPTASKSNARSTLNESDSEPEAMSVVTQSKTIRADSIFNLLKTSDDEEDEEEDDLKSRYARSSVYIKEDEEDDILDLMDRNALMSRIVPSGSAKGVKQKKLPKGLRMAADGRLVIEEGEDEMQSDESEDENDY